MSSKYFRKYHIRGLKSVLHSQQSLIDSQTVVQPKRQGSKSSVLKGPNIKAKQYPFFMISLIFLLLIRQMRLRSQMVKMSRCAARRWK